MKQIIFKISILGLAAVLGINVVFAEEQAREKIILPADFSCGETLGERNRNKDYYLRGNLKCEKNFSGVAITLAGHRNSFSTNGYALDCNEDTPGAPNGTVGILLQGERLKLNRKSVDHYPRDEHAKDILNCQYGVASVPHDSNQAKDPQHFFVKGNLIENLSVGGLGDIGFWGLNNGDTFKNNKASLTALSHTENLPFSVGFQLGVYQNLVELSGICDGFDVFGNTEPVTLYGVEFISNSAFKNDIGFMANNCYTHLFDFHNNPLYITSNVYKYNKAEANSAVGIYIPGAGQLFKDNFAKLTLPAVEPEFVSAGFLIDAPNFALGMLHIDKSLIPPEFIGIFTGLLNNITHNVAEKNQIGFATYNSGQIFGTAYGAFLKKNDADNNEFFDYSTEGLGCVNIFNIDKDNVWLDNERDLYPHTTADNPCVFR